MYVFLTSALLCKIIKPFVNSHLCFVFEQALEAEIETLRDARDRAEIARQREIHVRVWTS